MEVFDNNEETKEENELDNEKTVENQEISVDDRKNQEESISNIEDSQDVNKRKEVSYEVDKLDRKKDHRKTILISTILISFVLILAILSTAFALLNVNNNGIIVGIEIKGINLQGLDREQAIQKLSYITDQELEKDIKIKNGDFEYTINPSQIEAKYNIEGLVEEVYSVGRTGNIFINNFDIIKASLFHKNIDLELEYNNDLLEEVVSDIAVKVPEAVEGPSYYIEATKLIVTKGKAGNTIDKEGTKNLILEKIKNSDNRTIEISMVKANPDKINIEKIYNEIYTEAKDAYYTEDPFELFPEIKGVKFDLGLAKEIIKEDKEEYEIDLIITVPEITTNKLGAKAFPDLISSFTTKYDAGNVSRTTNLELAAGKLNGVVVMPDEVFSYNQTLGERTINDGYKEALGYIGGKAVPTLGGGICQISSTLYDAVVYANLEIVERRNHMFLTSYLPAGKDATVAYGSIDFRFKNTRKYPIMITSEVKNGVAKIEIYGIKEDIEYEVEIETTVLSYIPWKVVYETNNSLAAGQEKVVQGGMNGCQSITYKILKLNGVQISKEVLSRDTYDAMNKIIQKGPAKQQTNTNSNNKTNITNTNSNKTNTTNTNKNKTNTNTNKNSKIN